MKLLKTITSALALSGILSAQAAIVEVTNASITGTVNWTKDNTYVLNGYVFVENGEILNIQAGTVIQAKPGSGANVSALIVARGGKIFANGTAQEPIIFTAEADDVNDPEDLGIFDRGLWGGVVILGRAPINTAVNSNGNAANPKYDVYEGLPAEVGNFHYGGADADDNSGVFRYVSIRHGGKVLESNKEINGLSLCGVGRGTVIENVETYAIADDGYEFFGGTVNTKWLISAFNDDDAFDTDQGHSGKHQFWFSIQEPGKRDKGGEWNGEPNDIAVGNLPTGTWEVYNWTSIGAGLNSGGTGNNALTVRVYASPKVYNSIFTDYAQRGITIDATSKVNLDNGALDFRDNIWFGFTGGNTAANIAADANSQILFTDTARNNAIVDPMLESLSRTTNGLLKPFPMDNSPARTSARTAPNDGFYNPVAYKGAFGNHNWAKWSYLAGLGILTVDDPAASQGIVVTSASINGNVTWTKNNVYVLSGYVFVEDGETLTIEAGTVIKAQAGSGANVSALIVARGGKIFANGTAQEPIIFTAESDDVHDSEDLGIYDRGLWGGVVILGRAPINTAVNSNGNAASPKYDVYEGLPAEVTNFHYGGADQNDNSGVFRYVSIRHGGKVLESNKEINGLSLCGVGRGTVIENVETYAIADDGYEFFGGTVNTKYLISAFNDDDAFDTDQGHSGKHQFWFSIQEPGKRDKGGEWNGEPNDIAVGNLPTGTWEVYNWTSIGAGLNSGGTGNNALTVRVYASPKVYNSIFTDYAQRGITIDATSKVNLDSGALDFRDNIWFGFTGGNTAANIAADANSQILFTDTARNNAIVDPMLQSISRTTNGLLKPFPALDSPARTSPRTAPTDGFYSAAPYKGAFLSHNWAAWTYLAELGILTLDDGPVQVVDPAKPQLFTARNGQNLVISFPTEAGRTYLLQQTSTFANWAAVRGAVLTGDGTTRSFSVGLTTPGLFYRVSAE